MTQERGRFSGTLTVFGCVYRLGHGCDFARWGSIVAHLMQEVDGFTNQENLDVNRRDKVENGA